MILADRGFTVDEYFHIVLAEVITPPFTKGRKQLSRTELDFSRELSSVCIHVKRIIGLVKNKYTILGNVLPISLIGNRNHNTVFTDILTVCCAFVNLCSPIGPVE